VRNGPISRDAELIFMPRNIEVLNESCFFACRNLRKIIFEEGIVLREIGKNAFEKCGIERIVIWRSVEIASESCFIGCSNLKEVAFQEGSVEPTRFTTSEHVSSIISSIYRGNI
jgi:hypothetical protein